MNRNAKIDVNRIILECGPLSIAEIADVLDTTYCAIDGAYKRAMRKLRRNEEFRRLLLREAAGPGKRGEWEVRTVTRVRVSVEE